MRIVHERGLWGINDASERSRASTNSMHVDEPPSLCRTRLKAHKAELLIDGVHRLCVAQAVIVARPIGLGLESDAGSGALAAASAATSGRSGPATAPGRSTSTATAARCPLTGAPIAASSHDELEPRSEQRQSRSMRLRDGRDRAGSSGGSVLGALIVPASCRDGDPRRQRVVASILRVAPPKLHAGA